MSDPRLFRRDNVSDRQWVTFAYDVADQRQIGFITYDALWLVADERAAPEQMFDLARTRILTRAAEKVTASDLDREGRVIIDVDDELFAPDRAAKR